MWIFHFIAVYLCDIITNGAVLNPAMTIALYINGNITFEKSMTLSLAQYLAGPIGFILLKLCIPILKIEGPNNFINRVTQKEVIEGAYQEGIGMMIFTIIILASSKYIKSANINRGIVATTIRILSIINTKTGACLNPMIGWGWVCFLAGSIGTTTLNANNPSIFVYCLAPSIGACIGAIVFAILEFMMPSSSSLSLSTKQDITVEVPPASKAKTIRVTELELFSPKRVIKRIAGDTPTPLKSPRGRSKSPSSPKIRSKSPSSSSSPRGKSPRSKTPTNKKR